MGLSTATTFKHLNWSQENEIVLEGELLKKFQSYLLLMGDDIVNVCEKFNINYQLSGGTALGAVRHEGFIPWDDDMDFMIFGKDYEKFIEAMKKEYGNKYLVEYYKTPNYGLSFMRVRLNGTVYKNHLDIHEKDENSGFSIDIFIFENVFNNVILKYLHGWLCMFMGLLLSCRKFYENREIMKEIAAQNGSVKTTVNIKVFIGKLISWKSLESWAELTDRCYGMCTNEKSKFVSIPSGRKHYFGEMYKRDGMENTIQVSFEGRKWKVPKDYDGYFKALYGPDYMTPQAKEERDRHIILELKFPEDLAKKEK